MGATLATVSALLKEIYEKDVVDQLNNDTVGMKRIEKTSEGVTNEVGGRYVTFPVRTGRNTGIGARNENEALPTAGQQKTAAARVSLKYLYGAIRLTGQTISLADSNFQAFASALDEEMTGLKRDIAKDMNRQFYGAATGVMTSITADAANSITVANAQYLEVGMAIDVYDVTLVTNRFSNRTIVSITPTTAPAATVVYSGADASASIVATDVVIRTGNVNREVTGLGSIVAATGTLFNIDPVVEPVWKAVVNANGGTPRALTEALMIQTVDSVRTNGGDTTVGLTSLGVRRAYFNLLKTERRFVNTTDFEGGFKGLAFTTDKGDIPIVVDVDAPFGEIQFINEKQIKLYQESDWSWMNRDGSNLQRVIGFDAYEGTMYKYCEIGTHRRNSHARLDDLTEA
jgi:hypothetical protein